MCRKAAADMRFQTQEGTDGRACHVNNFKPIQHAQCSRIRCGPCQLLEMVLGEQLDVHRLKVCGSELEHSGPQQEAATITGYVTESFQSQQATPRGCGRDMRAARDVTEAQRCVIAPKRANDCEAIGESSHRLTAGCRCSTARHSRSLFRYPKSGKSGARSLTFRRRRVQYSFA